MKLILVVVYLTIHGLSIFLGAVLEANKRLLVMDLMKHGSIDRLLFGTGKYPLEDVSDDQKIDSLRVLTQMCLDASSGIMHMHSKNVLHRDIACRNFLVDAEHRAVVCDFGLSVALKPDTDNFVERREKPLPYETTAPETFASATYSFKTDVYSFGMFLWEIMARQQRIYPGFTFLEIRAGVSDRLHPLRPSIPWYCPREFADLMMDCWVFNPKQRPELKEINVRLKRLLDKYKEAEAIDSYKPYAAKPENEVKRDPSLPPLYEKYYPTPIPTPGSPKPTTDKATPSVATVSAAYSEQYLSLSKDRASYRFNANDND